METEERRNPVYLRSVFLPNRGWLIGRLWASQSLLFEVCVLTHSNMQYTIRWGRNPFYLRSVFLHHMMADLHNLYGRNPFYLRSVFLQRGCKMELIKESQSLLFEVCVLTKMELIKDTYIGRNPFYLRSVFLLRQYIRVMAIPSSQSLLFEVCVLTPPCQWGWKH